jgi:hypothetical protein
MTLITGVHSDVGTLAGFWSILFRSYSEQSDMLLIKHIIKKYKREEKVESSLFPSFRNYGKMIDKKGL